MFTPCSPEGYRAAGARADTAYMQLTARLVFMAAVTGYLLGRAFAGGASHPETLVYGATAALGLEFLIASWRSLWVAS